MKKLISLLITFCMVLSLGAVLSYAEDEMLDKKGWTAEASSTFANYTAEKVLDGKRETYWHTYYEVVEGKAGNKTPPPYELTIDLGKEFVISGFSYLPRTGESSTGRVTKYEIYGSDGTDNFVLIGSGEFPNNEDEKTVKFKNNIPVNKIKYKILDAVGGCGVVAEFDLVKEDAALPKVALSDVTAETFVSEAPKAEEKPRKKNLLQVQWHRRPARKRLKEKFPLIPDTWIKTDGQPMQSTASPREIHRKSPSTVTL